MELAALQRELVDLPIKKKSIVLDSMEMEDALTAMDMLGHDFFIFKEITSGRVNVAYLRNDGKYGVIETE